MHAVLFGMKRAFQASLRVTRRPLGYFGLTAARFDMLWCILQSTVDDETCPVWQSDVRKKLGVTAATVTRMMKSLEALGLLRRKRDFFDHRQIEVSLTSEGLDRIRAAYALFVERKTAERMIRSALGDERSMGRRRSHERPFEERFEERRFEERLLEERPADERPSDGQAAFSAMGRLGELLDRIREGFGDRAELHYPRRWIGWPG